MDYSKSYSATWRVFKVNTKTWADADRVENIDSIRITRTADGRMLESGNISLTGDFETGYYRVVMTAEQDGVIERIDVATLLFEETGGRHDYGVDSRDIDGKSVLYPAYTTAVVIGEYAPAGTDGAKYAGNILASVINAPVAVEGSFILNGHMVFEQGAAVIEAVWDVLSAGGFVIQIDGRGVVHIRPKPTTPAMVIENESIGLLTNEILFEGDTSDLPNRYIVIDGNSVTTAVNNDENSPISYLNRGFYVDIVDTSPMLINGETYGEYALRQLKGMSILREEKSYMREYADNVYLYDIIRASIDGMNGDFRVGAQSVSCGNGITVNEKCYREVSLW